jgi:PAS domain S-box-containing protein
MTATVARRPLRALYIEDDPRDVRLYNHHLAEGGFEVHAETVVTAEELAQALRAGTYDIILADHGLPNWSGIDAVDMLRREGIDIPLILVSGSLIDTLGVESIKRGATDYILKDRLARLSHAVERALDERAERAERQETERARGLLASLVESSDDAIMGISLDGAVLTWNRAATRIYGYESREILGKPFSSLFAPRWLEEIRTALLALRNEGTVARREISGLKKDGGTIDVAVTVAPIREADGVLTGAAAVVRDISDYKALREQLLFSQKMEAVGQLAAGVAHDFNNILTVVSGYSSLALSQLDDGDPVHAHIQEVAKAGDRAARLTRQLLAFSRKLILQPRLLNLNDVVAGMDGMLRRLIQEDIVLETAFDPNPGLVKMDPGQMEQVIMNLAVNARDAMPGGGKLRIETSGVDSMEEFAGPAVMLAVTDTGTGMERETQARIFEPFFTTKGQGGTGLGLSTVFGIVGQSGGAIRVESEPGCGTTFRIYLPRANDRTRDADSSLQAMDTAGPDGSETILIVEDEEAVRSLISRVLRSHGYKVLTVSNGVDALMECERNPGGIDLVVTDAVMPLMNGAELTTRLRALNQKIAILLISGHTDSTLLHQGVLSEDIAFLQKPFSPGVLALKVREVLDLPAD